ncbi:pentapeptide repeat-containing protein [Parasphingorhabdus pacifica]
MRDHRLLLTITTAVLMLLGTSTALLIFDPRVNGADALRTGGLAAGSVIALYALWLNDRRRRTDEHRQELDRRRQELDTERYALEERKQDLEHRRSDHDRNRAADERFARSVELLGNEADQVRVGALHALAGLASTHPDYTQTVLDVLCSYLRRPFDHPKWSLPSETRLQITPEQERERHVRQTAQRLIADLLPTTDTDSPPIYHLDLTRAWLERFDLSDRVVGRVAAYRCRFRHTTNFNRAEFRNSVHLRDSVFLGRIRSDHALYHELVQLRGIRSFEPCGFDGARFRGDADLKHCDFTDRVFLREVTFGGSLDLRHARFHSGVELSVHGEAPAVLLDDARIDPGASSSEIPEGWGFGTIAAVPGGGSGSVDFSRN